jgi:DNA-binding Lrp family transcriptional regulator
MTIRPSSAQVEELSAFEKQLCNNLQMGLAVCSRPYAEAASAMGVDEEQVLRCTRGLVKRGVIRRIGVVLNWGLLGKASTLVAAHVEQDNLKDAVEVVNALEGVSHNYLREHHYNLWFTHRADSQDHIEMILGDLSKRFGAVFHSLPAERIFKLDARFDAQSDGRRLLESDKPKPEYGPVLLDETDKTVLSSLQKGLEVTAEPFVVLCKGGLKIDEALWRIKAMMDKGVISRLGAVVNHNKLGFVANAMLVCEVEQDRVVEAGEKLMKVGIVSHCYQRRTFEGWPYNLFGMMHGRNLEDIHRVAKKFVSETGIKSWQLLATAETFKK